LSRRSAAEASHDAEVGDGGQTSPSSISQRRLAEAAQAAAGGEPLIQDRKQKSHKPFVEDGREPTRKGATQVDRDEAGADKHFNMRV